MAFEHDEFPSDFDFAAAASKAGQMRYNGHCFACDRQLGKQTPKEARVFGESTIVWVGSECFKHIQLAGKVGWQPPLGGPKLFDASIPLVCGDCGQIKAHQNHWAPFGWHDFVFPEDCQ